MYGIDMTLDLYYCGASIKAAIEEDMADRSAAEDTIGWIDDEIDEEPEEDDFFNYE